MFRWFVGLRRFRFFDEFLDDAVVAMRELVKALVTVEGGSVATDVEAFLYAPVVPVGIPRKNVFKVFFSEMVLGVGRMLHDGGFVLPWRRFRGGKMLCVTGSSSTG